MISLTFDTYNNLFALKETLPDLIMSTVEYTLDIICKDAKSVGNLFNLFRRYIYCPNQTATKLYNSEMLNRTYYIDTLKNLQSLINNTSNFTDFQTGKLRFKIYERGKDNDRSNDKGWSRDKLDRVRIEYKAYSKIFNDNKLFFLSDFLADCKFIKIFKDRFKFKKFNDTCKKCPKEWENYNNSDQDGNINSFQEEYIQNHLSNKSQHISTPKGFDIFISKISKAIHEYDVEWKRNYDQQFQ
jgi:hypothetical protein